jgi:ferredoxin
VLLVSVVMVGHGLFGPTLAPKNLATVLTWVHFRGALVLVMLCAGNFFCLACPFMALRNAARRIFRPRLNWPQKLRNKGISVGLFVLILFAYELFDLWASPWWTAWLIVAYFLAVLLVDGVFKHASFCKFVCPIGQFNFLASTLSPLEVKVRNQDVCDRCGTKDCIRGVRENHGPAPGLVVIQRGCELALFQPRKVGNMDCTFCLDCVHACPHDNVGIMSRLPGNELMVDPLRSGIGYFSRRKDLAALGIVFCFGALLNAFGMVSPVYALEEWLGRILHVSHEAPVLGLIFVFFLLLEPLVLVGGAAWLTRVWGGNQRAALPLAVRYSYALVPLGFGMWLAHYGFHFFTGLLTAIPVTQNAFAAWGWPILGTPLWTLTGLPTRFVQPLEFGFLILGLSGSLLVAYRLAEEDSPGRTIQTFTPWAVVCFVIWLSSIWLMVQPMEMRATMMGG